ncbi:MAG TPA: ankyrin repeat domain-containing protein [Candidatus Megaira endosymbiont of Nemacystus decipiens]|nr:ankyrin repeat domain-containing protein [Candidatus Megaera endosymbiont of Nemacystus decipiens]
MSITKEFEKAGKKIEREVKRVRDKVIVKEENSNNTESQGIENKGYSKSGLNKITGSFIADTKDNTALEQLAFLAVVHDRVDFLEEIVKNLSETELKSLLNTKDAEGSSLLHYAAGIGSLGMSEYLLNKGADLNAVNNDGSTVLDAAIHNIIFTPSFVNKEQILLVSYLAGEGAAGGVYKTFDINTNTIESFIRLIENLNLIKQDDAEELIKAFAPEPEEESEQLIGEQPVEAAPTGE